MVHIISKFISRHVHISHRSPQWTNFCKILNKAKNGCKWIATFNFLCQWKSQKRISTGTNKISYCIQLDISIILTTKKCKPCRITFYRQICILILLLLCDISVTKVTTQHNVQFSLPMMTPFTPCVSDSNMISHKTVWVAQFFW